MSIQVDTPDGVVEFPDGTPPEVMTAALRKHYAQGQVTSAPGYNPTMTGTGQPLRVDIGGTPQPAEAPLQAPAAPQPVAAPAPAAPDRSGFVSALDAGVRGAVAGVTGNFGDEISAAANSIIPLDAITGQDVSSIFQGKSPLAAFRENMVREAAKQKADAEQSPIISGVSNIAGTVGGAILGARGLSAAADAIPALSSAAERLPGFFSGVTAKSAAGGAVGGAVSGFGEGDTLENRERSAGGGAVLGGFAGGAIGNAVERIGPTVARYARVLTGRGTEQEGLRQIVTSLQRDGFDMADPAGVAALQQEIARFGGKPVSIADIGAATRARAGVGLRAPSAVQARYADPESGLVAQRAAGAGPRLQQDIRATVAPRTDIHALDDALVQQRAEQALPLRDAALYGQDAAPLPDVPQIGLDAPKPTGLAGFNAPVPTNSASVPAVQGPFLTRTPVVPEDPALQTIARMQFIEPEVKQAQSLLEAEHALLSAQGKPTDHLPTDLLDPMRPLDMRSLDYIKRKLDTAVSSAFRSGDSAVKARAAQLRDVRNALRDRMRAVGESAPGAGDGAYGQYLDAYKGSSDMIDALTEGRNFRKLDPEQIAAGQAGRSTAEQELYRVGAARDLSDVVSSTRSTGNPARNLLPSAEDEAQLAATGADAPELIRRVAQERQLAQLPAELSGAQTAQRLAAASDADAGTPTLPFNIGSPLGWLGALAKGVGNRARLQNNRAVNEAILPRLLATDPAIIQRTIQELVQAGRQDEARLLANAVRARAASVGTGAAIGGPAALTENR